MKKIAVITARSGSKGLKDKNILLLDGKPLMSYTIEAAIKSACFERVIVSTDSEEYGEIAKKYGAEFILRSKENSSDKATTYDVLKELFGQINMKEYDYFVLLQPTSPLRNENHIIEAIKLYEEKINDYEALVSVVETEHSSILINSIEEDNTLKNFDIKKLKDYRRQSYKEYYPNGAIFISKFNEYLEKGHFFGEKTIAYYMNKEDSIDIDGKIDFELATLILNKRKVINHIERIKKRIYEKKEIFKNANGSITFIGHSFLDYWNIEKIKDKTINNLAICGITSKWYNELIFENMKFKSLGEYVVVFLGTSDIIYEKNLNVVIDNINKTLKYIRMYNPKKVIFLNISNVNGRMDRDNNYINVCKKEFKNKIEADVIINLDSLNNRFGKLDEKYTYDGLHPNALGYQEILKLIEKEIQ